MKSGTLILRDGLVWPEGQEKPSVWRKVDPSRIHEDESWFGLALCRREKRTGRTDSLEAFQLVLSDSEGVLPWQPGYTEASRPLQPELYLPLQAKLAADARL